MLILTRKPGESIIIDDVVKVTALSIQGRQVRLGITAPREVAVHREEIYQRLQEEKQAQSNASSTDKPVDVVVDSERG